MQGGAAGGARSRPPADFQGAARFPLYSLFPTQPGTRPTTIQKVTTESVFSQSFSFGVPTPPPSSPFSPLCAPRLQIAEKEPNKMDDAKLGKCMPEVLCCPSDQRPMMESLGMMQPLTIKTEQAKRSCNTCLTNSPKKIIHSDGGCSRTNPVTWVGVAGQNVQVQVKREPQQLHVSELVAVKLEQASPGTKPDNPPPAIPASLNNVLAGRERRDLPMKCDRFPGSIPVGIAVARQRVGDAGLLAALSQKDQQRMHDIDAQAAMTVGVANMICDDRSAPIAWPAPPPPAPPAPLWQYPAQVTMESMMVGSMGGMSGMTAMSGMGGMGSMSSMSSMSAMSGMGMGMSGVGGVMGGGGGLQLVRDAATGALLLLGGELPGVLWGGVGYPAPLLLPPAPPLVLPADLLAPHPRLVTLSPAAPAAAPPPDKRKPLLLAPHAIVKLEPERERPPEAYCAAECAPTPPPEPAQRDQANQTDTVSDDDCAPPDDDDAACVGVASCLAPPLSPPATSEPDTAADSCSSGSGDLVIDTAPPSAAAQLPEPPAVDISGLELLSNSIEQFERTTPKTIAPVEQPLTIDTRPTQKLNMLIKTSPKSPPRLDPEPVRFEYPSATSAPEEGKRSFDGLGLLCALAEQRIMEDVRDRPLDDPAGSADSYIKSEPLMSPIERDLTEASLKKDKHRHRDGDSSSERRRKRSHDREERLRRKLEKMRRHKRERERDDPRTNDEELEASLRRVTACNCGTASCSHTPPVPSAQALVNAIEKDMRERLKDLQRQCDEKRAQLNAMTPPLPALSTPPTPSTPALSPDSDRGSSKKRKVGRPRKVSSPDSTETIVAKKPKSKSSLVGYLLAKGKLKGGILCSRSEPSREEPNRTSKVRPKLKAEPILKNCDSEDETECTLNRSASSSMESLNEVRLKNREKVDRLVRKHSRDDISEFTIRRASASSDSEKERKKAKKRRKSEKSRERSSDSRDVKMESIASVSRCTLTEDKLDANPRVLTAMGGLFYAGKLSAVTAPDVYAITLDGERGNKPHILSREETLRDAILEVTPQSTADLPSGTRVCAYWSQQYRCLYPGTVGCNSPSESEDNFVPVEFDDGDSGRIALQDIRLLQPDYPLVEYENPLFTLGKRRRNTSASGEDKKSSDPKPSTSESTPKPKTDDEDERRDRKKLKKHRKDKMKRHQSTEDDPNTDYVKKKKKKHKCCEDHCKRRHHKKHHRKHRKRHHSNCKDHSCSSGDDQKQKTLSDFADCKSNEDSGDSNDRLSTLIAVEKSPEEKMKTVIKKAVLSKKALVKSAILDFNNMNKTLKEEEVKDNLKDSGIGLELTPQPGASETSASKKKAKRRTVSSSSEGGGHSKMAAFLPGAALWRWSAAPYRRARRRRLHRAVRRADERIHVGDAAVFLSTGRADRPYIGRVVALWEARGAMAVRVKWFYHPEETSLTATLKYPGGLFESPHTDENDVQTISHKCEVLSLEQYKERMGDDPVKYSTVYDNNDVYYLAGHYDPTQQTLAMQPGVPFADDTS